MKNLSLEKTIAPLRLKKVSKFSNVERTMEYSLSRLDVVSNSFYIAQVRSAWQVGAEMIVNSKIVSDSTKVKTLVNLFRLTSLNEINKFNERLWFLLRQTDILK